MTSEEFTDKLYRLQNGEVLSLAINENFKRVPGGWIYIISNGNNISSIFIPYNEEFNSFK